MAKPGRKPIGKRAMTPAERQRARRKREAAKIPQPVAVKMELLRSFEDTEQEVIEIAFMGADKEARVYWASWTRDKLEKLFEQVFTGKTAKPKARKAPAKKKTVR